MVQDNRNSQTSFLDDDQEDQSNTVPEVKAPRPAAKRVRKARKSAGAFRTISEVADDLGVQQHVLRFWESKFSQVTPLKRGGGRRYYRPEDVELLRRIHGLLYVDGYTIKGVQKLLSNAKGPLSAIERTKDQSPTVKEIEQEQQGVINTGSSKKAELSGLLEELRAARELLNEGGVS